MGVSARLFGRRPPVATLGRSAGGADGSIAEAITCGTTERLVLLSILGRPGAAGKAGDQPAVPRLVLLAFVG